MVEIFKDKSKELHDFFRQNTLEKQGIDLNDVKAEKEPAVTYPFFIFFPFVVGILNTFFTVFLCWEFNFNNHAFESYSGIGLWTNIPVVVCGIFGTIFSNKKKFPLIGTILGMLLFVPLAAIYVHFAFPPTQQ